MSGVARPDGPPELYVRQPPAKVVEVHAVVLGPSGEPVSSTVDAASYQASDTNWFLTGEPEPTTPEELMEAIRMIEKELGIGPPAVELPYSPERVVEMAREFGEPRMCAVDLEIQPNHLLGRATSFIVRPNLWTVSTDIWEALMEGVPIAYVQQACARAARRDDFERHLRWFGTGNMRHRGVVPGHPGGGRAARRRGEARIRRARYLGRLVAEAQWRAMGRSLVEKLSDYQRACGRVR